MIGVETYDDRARYRLNLLNGSYRRYPGVTHG